MGDGELCRWRKPSEIMEICPEAAHNCVAACEKIGSQRHAPPHVHTHGCNAGGSQCTVCASGWKITWLSDFSS